MSTARISAPPADPSLIVLTYTHVSAWTEDSPELVSWHVSADLDTADEDVEYTCDPDLLHVGDFQFMSIPTSPSLDQADLLDQYGGTTTAGSVLFNVGTGGLVDELDDELEPFGDLALIADGMVLAPTWRGFGLGAVLVGTAIKKLSAGVRVVAFNPGPIADDMMADPSLEEVAAATAKLAAVWEQLGFKHFKEGVYILDPAKVYLDDGLAKLKKRLMER